MLKWVKLLSNESKRNKIIREQSVYYIVLQQALALSTAQGYKGYGPEQGNRVKFHCPFLV